MDPLKDFLDAVAVAVDRAQVLASSAELATEARGPVAEQPTRDPRIDPRPGDVIKRVRYDTRVLFVIHVADGYVWAGGPVQPFYGMSIENWRFRAEGARILTPEEGVRDV